MAHDSLRVGCATYDTTSKIITTVVFVIVVIVIVLTRNAIIGGLCAALIAVSFLYSIRGYEITGGAIVVKRFLGKVLIPLDSVRGIRAATPADFEGSIRLWGNGGVFGYYGLFQTTKLGKCSFYVTNRNNTVVVATDEKNFVLSPADVAGFIAAVHDAAPAAGGSEEVPETVRFAGGKRTFIYWILAAIGLVALGMVVLATMYAPGPPSYTLTPASLAIHDRFYPVTVDASDVDVTSIRVVDIATDPEWRPTARTNGFSNAHYHSGWFRVASGKTVRMYWANATLLVLLPPLGNGTPVLLEENNPDQFASQLQREWRGR